METEAPSSAPRANRPNPILLILFGLVVIVALWMKLGGSAGSGQPSSNRSRTQSQAQSQAAALAQHDAPRSTRKPETVVDPEALDVKLEALESERPGPADTERNPFRFRPKPPPPLPPSPVKPPGSTMEGGGPVAIPPPQPPPPPPPITVKLIGFIERADGTKLAVFVDCTQGREQLHAKEGGVIGGRYRLVRIQLNSAIVEHLDGRGRTTLPVSGQECVTK
jgi:hypothetical protein